MQSRWRPLLFLSLADRNSRIIFTLLLFVLYSLGYKLFVPIYEDTLGTFFFAALLAIPVLTAALLLGTKAGLLAWCASIPLEIALVLWCGDKPLDMLVENGGLIGFGLLLFSTIPAGKLHDLKQQINQELSGRHNAENALHESQHFVKQVMEHIPDIVYIHDLDTNSTVYVNHAVSSVLGYTPEAVRAMGDRVDEIIIHPDDLVSTAPEVRRKLDAAKNGEVVVSEYRAKHAQGDWRYFFTQEVVFLRGDKGTAKQLLGIAQDITERKKSTESLLENELLQLTLEKERELSYLKNRLMTTLSHEFRTPLSIILASNELLERYFDRLTPVRREECLITIKTQIMHLREMLDDISTLVSEGDMTPHFKPNALDLAETVARIVENFQASMGASYIIHFQANGDLNPISADADLLRVILKNLLSNAVKYSSVGQPIYCGLSRQGDDALLTVRDEGIGIPANEQSLIFDTFHRASNALNTGGLGLGLRIVRDYVKLHQGTVTIESEVGKGTTVTVCLPVDAKSAAKS
ncbi:MAG: PAS domain-containing sensor histidine kinase [Chloroflexota bacterium]